MGEEEEGREEEEDLHPAVGPPKLEVGATAVIASGPNARRLMLKLPYRACSAGPIWTRGSCPTRAGARPRSDRTRPGSWKEKEEEAEAGHHQLHPNALRLLMVLLSILVVLEP